MPTANFTDNLLDWFQKNKRDLPWRHTRDPYPIWVSEIMLQQTRVAKVIPYYERFLTTLPHLAALARAPEELLLRLWAGLGYYNRVRNMARAARIIQDKHGGLFPREYLAVLALPGIGEYTAGAILSMAFQARLPAIDGNVLRVFARLFVIAESIDQAPARKQIRHRVLEYQTTDQPGDYNQALMELGATICLPQNPVCGECPVTQFCHARRQQKVASLPVTDQPPGRLKTTKMVLIIEREGQFFLIRNRPGEAAVGLWEFPYIEKVKTPPRSQLEAAFLERYGFQPVKKRKLGRMTQSIMNRDITIEVSLARVRGGDLSENEGQRFFTPADLAVLPLSAAGSRVLEVLRNSLP